MRPSPTRERTAEEEPWFPRIAATKVRLVGGLLLAIGVWGTVAPYIGPQVTVRAIVELVDHVVPGVVVLGVALLSLYRRRFDLVTAGLSLLAALWMFSTHVPLLAQAVNGEAPWAGSLWMFVPSALILALSLSAIVLAWRDEA